MAIHYYYEADTSSDLYNTILNDGTLARMCGLNIRGDQPSQEWLYNSSSNAVDDGGISVIKPTLQTGSGRWVFNDSYQAQVDWNETNSNALDYIKNKPIIPATQVNSDWNSTSGLSEILNRPTIPSLPSRTYSIGTPTLNSSSQLSPSQDARFNCSVSITVTSTLLGTNSGTVSLQISANNSTWNTITQAELSIVGVATTISTNHTLCADVPAGYYVRLLKATSGANGASISAISGQTILLG